MQGPDSKTPLLRTAEVKYSEGGPAKVAASSNDGPLRLKSLIAELRFVQPFCRLSS